MLPNIPVMWECHFGIPKASCVLNAINTRLDSKTVKFILGHGEAKLFIYDSEYSLIIEKALEGVSNPPILVEFIDKIGLKEHLSPTRSNGLLSMIKQIKYYALAFNKN